MMERGNVAEIGCLLARRAGVAILSHYGQETKVVTKGDGSPLTQADQEAHQIIVDGLEREFPGIPVRSEEADDDGTRLGAPWCFLVDPLDGTKVFLSHNGEFTVNIALIHGGRPVAGVVYAPALDDLYWAWEGGGAWRQHSGANPEAIHTSPYLVPPRLAVSRSHRSAEEDRFIADHGVTEVVAMGSSLKGCLVARGDAELYLRAGTVMEWDIAAMDAIVTEAGGRLVAWADRTKPLVYNKPDLRVEGFICTSSKGPL